VDAEELKRLLSSLLVFVGALVIAAFLPSSWRRECATQTSLRLPRHESGRGEPGWLDPTAFPPERGD